MEPGEWLTRWTIRVALACAAAALLAEAARPRGLRLAQRLWAIGLLLFWSHLAAAFHFYHDWSHAEATAHTARRTLEVVGRPFPDGVYFNYLFALLWSVDVVLRLMGRQPAASPGARRRFQWWFHKVWIGYFAFITLQATVVFETGAIRWISLVVAVLILGVWIRSRRKRGQVLLD